MIYDRTDDANPPPLPPESNIPCIHSIIEKVNEEFQFWTNIPNRKPYGDNGNTYNDTLPNQADYCVLTYSSEDLDHYNSEALTNDTNLEQSNEVNSLFDEINAEYSFWPPHQNKEYPVNSICASTEEEYHEDLVGVLDGTRQDILNVESENYNDNYYGSSESKERILYYGPSDSKDKIVLPSLIFPVVKNDAVMKGDADSREVFYNAPNPEDNSSSLNDGKYYDAPISNEEAILNYIIQKKEQQISVIDL